MGRRLEGKVAVITGGASGIGAATTRRFRTEGAEVVVGDVQDAAGEAVAGDCGASFYRLDVTDEGGWARLMAVVEERHGHLDILMNNAGMLGGASIETVELAAWNRVMAVNVTGVMLGCRAAIGLMRRNPGGSIINISSTAAYGALGGDIAYTASKAAVRMLTKSVAVWCARQGLGIRCNSIHPGPILTPIFDPMRKGAQNPEEVDQLLSAMVPMGHPGKPDDIAAMAVFLASDEAGFVTGGEFLVDGGTMAPHPGI